MQVNGQYSPQAQWPLFEGLEHQSGPFPLCSTLQSKITGATLPRNHSIFPMPVDHNHYCQERSKGDLTNRDNYTAKGLKYSLWFAIGGLSHPYWQARSCQACRYWNRTLSPSSQGRKYLAVHVPLASWLDSCSYCWERNWRLTNVRYEWHHWPLCLDTAKSQGHSPTYWLDWVSCPSALQLGLLDPTTSDPNLWKPDAVITA